MPAASSCFDKRRVVRRGITNAEHRERVEGLHFEIVRILVAQLPHCFLVGDYPIARSRPVRDTIVQPELRSNCPPYCNRCLVR